jgi:hypothetical protein
MRYLSTFMASNSYNGKFISTGEDGRTRAMNYGPELLLVGAVATRQKPCLFPICLETNSARPPGLRMTEAVGPDLFFKWAAGAPRSRILARLHRPENCLPAAGYNLKPTGVSLRFGPTTNDPFHANDFEYDGRQEHVFFCIWQDDLKSGQQFGSRDHWDDRLVGA